MVGRQIGHRKSSSAFSARFPVLNWRSRVPCPVGEKK